MRGGVTQITKAASCKTGWKQATGAASGYLHESGGRITNAGAMRIMSLSSTHFALLGMLVPDARNLKLFGDSGAVRQLRQLNLIQSMKGIANAATRAFYQREVEQISVQEEEERDRASAAEVQVPIAPSKPARTPGGVEEVNEICKNDGTFGLRWMFYGIRESAAMSMPETRINIIRATITGSSKYAYVLHEAMRLQDLGERLLVYFNHPISAM